MNKGHFVKALLIYPEFPDTFWSFRYALKFIHRKASSPPLGLLTVAAMLPKEWEKRLIDMNVESLNDEDLRWAELVFVSAMSVQKESVKEVLAKCKAVGVRIVAGGHLFTTEYESFGDIDHLVLNEAEITLPHFLKDFEKGAAAHFYTTDQWADIRESPIPLWELINMKHYASINIQYSRGCPYNCEFCDITLLCGRTPRTKDKDQIIRELESVYASGFRGQVFFVDDNFIGNKNRDLLVSVRNIQKSGLEVQGGFIIGFDNDPLTIFDDQVRFIQESGIVTAMVGILIALPRTQLYERLKREQRLLKETSGNNTDFATNFIPRMDYDLLISGYKKVLSTLYSPKHYYERVRTFLKEYIPPKKKLFHFRFNYIAAFIRSIIVLGIIGKERFYYWGLLLWTIFSRPRLFPHAVTLSIYGFHFRKIFEKHLLEYSLTQQHTAGS